MDVGGFRQPIAVGAIMGVEEEYAVAPNATQNSVIPLSRPPHTRMHEVSAHTGFHAYANYD